MALTKHVLCVQCASLALLSPIFGRRGVLLTVVTLPPEIRDAVKKELGVFSWPTHVDSTEKARPSSHRAQLEQSNSVKSLNHIPASHTVDRAAETSLHWLNEQQSSPSTSEDHVSSLCTPSPVGVFHDVFWTSLDDAAKPPLWSCCISSDSIFYVGLFFSAYLRLSRYVHHMACQEIMALCHGCALWSATQLCYTLGCSTYSSISWFYRGCYSYVMAFVTMWLLISCICVGRDRKCLWGV